MPASWNRNRLTAKLGIDYPIIQGPLGGLSSQRLTAAVSNFGGLGSFGAHALAPEAIKDVIAQIRSLTSKPFAMSLMEELNRKGTEILPYPLQRGLVRNLSIAAEAADRSDLLPLWAGQSANLLTCTDLSAFLNSLVEEVSEIAGPVIQWSANRRQKHSNSQ
jgi:hypothetical protein